LERFAEQIKEEEEITLKLSKYQFPTLVEAIGTMFAAVFEPPMFCAKHAQAQNIKIYIMNL